MVGLSRVRTLLIPVKDELSETLQFSTSMVDVPRFELANLCAQEQLLLLRGFLLGLKAASRLK